MASVASVFATTLTRATGLELKPGGEVQANGETLFRLNCPATEQISDSAFFELTEWLRVHMRDDPALVFRYAREIGTNDLGALGLAMKSAPTLRDIVLSLHRTFPP